MDTSDNPEAHIDDDGLPFAPAFGDHYYSRHDGRKETEHVFLQGNGLPERWSGPSVFIIGELGFGTGLNFLETWRQWIATRKPGQLLRFVSVEGFPLSKELAEQALQPWPELQNLAENLTDRWENVFAPLAMDEQTELHVLHGDVRDTLLSFPLVDAWYLDGFAPAKNADMWAEDVMQMVADHTAPNGTFSSYTAAGWVRRNLEDAGFTVEKRPGFGTKRDMIAGYKP